MVDILPFRRTNRLISETDEFIDKVSEAAMVLERTFATYLDDGPGDFLDERLECHVETLRVLRLTRAPIPIESEPLEVTTHRVNVSRLRSLSI